MKKNNSKIYLYVAAVGLLIIIVLICYFLFIPLAKSEQVEYVYIDADDTQDSVFAKIAPLANTAALNGLKNISRHSDYSENIRTGRYAINPGEGALMTFRRLRNGIQSSMKLTIPEVRTMDRLASVLGQKLMLDSATIANALYSDEVCLLTSQPHVKSPNTPLHSYLFLHIIINTYHLLYPFSAYENL